MRILMFSDSSPEYMPFIMQDVIEISKIHELKYICTVSQYTEKYDNIDIEYIPYNLYNIKSKVRWRLENLDISLNFRDKRFSRKLINVIEKFKPDLIHCQFGYEALKLFDNYNCENIPVIISFRGYDASYKLTRKVFVDRLKKILSADNVYATFVCNNLRKNLEFRGIIINRSIILYSGVNADLFKRSRFDHARDPLRFLQVGSFIEKKGQIYTIKAFNRFLKNNPDVNAILTFIGEGVLLDKCRKLTRELNLSGHVIFIGKLDHRSIVQYLENSHVFVHHSITASDGHQEGIPNSLIEAMAMELPVISTFHSGIPELVEDDINGFLVNEKDIDSYADKMEEILTWGYLKINREKVVQSFNLEGHLKKILDLYEEVTA